MKNKWYSIAFILCLLTVQKANSQWMETGNTATSSYFIGTMNYQPFRIFTDAANSPERMRVDANGNVGIGTIAPNYLLHLNNNSGAAVYQQFTNATTGTSSGNGLRVGIDASGNGWFWQQNVPNPFAEQTSISYFIPENTESAQMLFTDLSGKEIKTVDLETGNGVMTVFASNLSSGQYQYTLFVDGKVYGTKKMVKGK